MNIGIIGYGKMGKAIEQLALQRGHNIAVIVDENNSEDIAAQLKGKVDVAIEFTTPESGKNNVFDCIEAGIPIVSGTTGWNVVEVKMQKICEEKNTSFFYASNFSIGVNIFTEVNEKLASLLSDFESYDAKMQETHHIHKLDKPSGTAISLANGIFKNNKKYVNWELKPVNDIRNLEIESLREGEIIGDHKIIWESEIDTIEISHSAKNRIGFALGAVLAAEFVYDKVGFYTMRDLLKL